MFVSSGQMYRTIYLVRVQIKPYRMVAIIVSRKVTGRRVHNGCHGVEQTHETNFYVLRPRYTVFEQSLGQKAALPLADFMDSMAGSGRTPTEAEQVEC